MKLATVATFSFADLADWAQDPVAIEYEMISDGLASFRAVAEASCLHQAVIVRGRHPNELPAFRWINTELSNVKTSFRDTFHTLKFDKEADRYLVPSIAASTGASNWQR